MYKIKNEHDFIIIGSDGVWDSLSSKEVIKFCWENITKVDLKKSCSLLCESLMNEAIRKGSLDNISIICIPLNGLHEYIENMQYKKFPRILF